MSSSFALDPRNPAERFVFAQVYETLLRVDCEDRLVAGLAEHWTTDSTSQLWTLTIRPDATFSDGSPVTSEDVLTSFRERRSVPGAFRDPAGPAIDMIAVEGVRRVTVHLREPHPEGPRVLADPAFAVHRSASPGSAPLGTGAYLAPTISDVTMPVSAPVVLAPRASGPVLVVRTIASNDARDVLDGGADALVTSDRRVIDYAALRAELRSVTLPADRAYVLLSTIRPIHSAQPDTAGDPRWSPIRASLARDVVRAAAPPQPEPWWGAASQAAACTGVRTAATPARAGVGAAARPRRLVYAVSDRLAGEIAQRLVALATFDGGSGEGMGLPQLLPEWFERTDVPLTAAAFSDSDIELALMHGSELGYIVALPRRALDPCSAWRRLTARAPWVAPGLPILVAEGSSMLVMSARAPGLTSDWQNTLRVIQRPEMRIRP